MSDDDKELEELRRRKLQELQHQAVQQQVNEAQHQDLEKKIYLIMRQILSQEGRQRLENIRIVKPEFAQQIEMQLIQLYQAGKLRGATPLSDQTFKKLLEQITGTKKDFKIKNL